MKFSATLIFLLSIVTGSPAKQTNLNDIPSINGPQMEFVPNKGQWEDVIRYQADMKGGRVYLEDHGITYFFYNQQDISRLHPHEGSMVPDTVHAHAVKIDFVNANRKNNLVAVNASISIKNYYLGNDPSLWAPGLHAYRKVNYDNLYNGINLSVYSNGSDFKYDFIVSAGASPDIIKLNYSGCDRLYIEKGKLMMLLSVGTVQELHPYAYQLINGIKKSVACEFILKEHEVSFRFAKGYDATQELVIDPTLVFSSFTGSYSDNWGYTATYDAAGNLIVGGNINGAGYPVTAGAYQLTYKGPAAGLGHGGGNTWGCDIAIAKFNSTGTNLIYATYLGGSDNEEPHSLLVDGNNDLLVLGITFSNNFPVTAGAYNTVKKGGGDLILTKFNSTGTALLASTYVGGSGDDGTNITANFYSQTSLKFSYGDECRAAVVCDANNDFYVTTCTQSSDFPVTAGVIQPTFGGSQDAVVFKMNNQLDTLVWSTYLGGSGDDGGYSLKLDSSNNIYVAGGTASGNFPTTQGTLHPSYQGVIDGFATLINPSGTSILKSTYIGTNAYDQVFFVDLDNAGNVYLCGQTMGAYPVTNGVYSNPGSGQFIHELDPQLSTTIFSTTFGTGSAIPNISESAFLVDVCGNIYVSGWGRCLNFGNTYPAGSVNGMPITANALQKTTDGCDFYFFVLTPNATSLAYATFFGGNLSKEHVDGGTSRFDKHGIIYEAVCAGCGGNSDFPTTPGVWSNTNNSDNCNNGVIKLNFGIASVNATATASPQVGCLPLSVTFNSNVAINATSYHWDFGDGSPTDTAQNTRHSFSHAGTYNVNFIAYGACVPDTVQLTVVADTTPVASFTYTSTPCNPEVNFVNNSSSASSYLWEFGDGDSSLSYNLSHTYKDTGTYNVKLIAGPGTPCAATDVQTIKISGTDTNHLFIPNIFTPNDDKVNDLFELKGVGGCHTYHIQIYNRWGKLLFESSDPKVFWDGKISGVAADEGVYFYELEVDKQSYHGTVNIKR